MAALDLMVDHSILLETSILVIADNCFLESRERWPNVREVHALGHISLNSLRDVASQIVMISFTI